ncbi:MAG: ferritin-like domain-containing protein [Chloroflexi bacterium]|nr:ferritin-like domain-containing protein [Chloroflexota bacterium]
MRLHTSSEVMTFCKKMEHDSANYYTNVAQQFRPDAETLLTLVKENTEHITQIERAYYGVITDAIEGCFAFDVDPVDFAFEETPAKGISFKEAVEAAIDMEERIARFYQGAGEQSRGLMADVSRVFTLIAKKRRRRISNIQLLLSGLNPR